jgi:5-methylthioadenosine/S-adenosylhomocysteine deaminase
MEPRLLIADHIVTMAPGNPVLVGHAVLVEDGRIAAVGPAPELEAAHPRAARTDLKNCVLMPGLVNAHCHSGLLRGTAEGQPVWEWLRLFIDPMHRVLRADEAEIASWLCYAEAILSGTTTLVDMWRFMHGSARAADALGLRVVLVPYVGEHPSYNYFETLDTNEQLINDWHGKADGRIHVWVGLEHMFYAVPEAWKRAAEMSRRYKVGFHTHSNESRYDVEETLRRYGVRPIEALGRHGLLDAHRVLIAHAVWLSDEEIAVLAERGAAVAHNPISNLKLASGIAPVEALLAAGIAVGLGTDGEKENNNLDMFEELKVASLLAKLKAMNAAALDSWDTLRIGTILGAKAIGLDHEIGSLEVGKKADIIAVRSDTPRMTPLLDGEHLNLHHNLVHAVRGGDVAFSMVDGRVLVEDGRLLSAELSELVRRANKAVPPLLARRSEWLRTTAGAATPIQYE